ncbi:Hypothetical protein R9X50_00153500 [Acrodontium crateriforme]|uniref:Quinate repressor protein n=1 Tax=Acrodontium crateriforme TaxID=150365 RepID=A0AAQ3M5D1_9PEZI|nr:Hypothetical protein R9X50_00153500 [Acrodontium crateriforme]
MAALHAGVKRSYELIGSHERDAKNPRSTTPSKANGKSTLDLDVAETRSGRVTPSSRFKELASKVSFESDASLVLIGVNGVGKSSLGVLAATAYNRRLIDSERAFHDATGSTPHIFRKLNGTAAYHKKHCQILSQTLKGHDKDCIIVCNFSDLENQGAAILREFSQTHPTVHITRDVQGIQSYLKVWSEEKINQLLQMSGPVLRSCSNYNFFNLTEKLAEEPSHDKQDQDSLPNTKSSSGLFLTLKRVERDFLRLLRNVIGDHKRTPSHYSAYPLSQIPVHERRFTVSAVVSIDEIIDEKCDLDSLQVGVDAIDLQVPLVEVEVLRGPSSQTWFRRTAAAFATLRRATTLPVILTVVRGTKSMTLESARAAKVELTGHCLRLGPEYCTIDLSLNEAQIAALLAGKGRTNIIASWHFTKPPADGWNDSQCTAVYAQAEHLGCEVVKITMPATTIQDNFAAQGFREKMEATHRQLRLICYNTGRRGKPSMCFNPVLTPVRPPRDNISDHTDDDDDPQVSAKDVVTSLFATFVYEPMKFFIYGANVTYSLSPAMHNAAYSACGMPHNYGMHSSPTLDEFRRLSHQHDFGGSSVVQPYKTGVVPLLDGMSSHAKAIGSVNTIIPVRELREDGSIPSELDLLKQVNRTGPVKALYGYNTDWIGIRACLRRGLSPANTVRPQTSALVCGAGGQARSTIYALLSLGVRNIFVCNRTLANAHILADHYNNLIASNSISELSATEADNTRVRVLDTFDVLWPTEFRHPSLIVSSVPTQNADGTSTNFTLNEDWLKSPTGGVVIELAYRSINTPIVRQMRTQAAKGWIFMDGFDILPEQAYAQFEHFTGRRAPRNLMRSQVIAHYKEQQKYGLATMDLDPNPTGN